MTDVSVSHRGPHSFISQGGGRDIVFSKPSSKYLALEIEVKNLEINTIQLVYKECLHVLEKIKTLEQSVYKILSQFIVLFGKATKVLTCHLFCLIITQHTMLKGKRGEVH